MSITSSNPLDRDVNVAIGVTLPLRKSNTGYFEQSFKTIDQVKSNIKNLLQTRKGERVMQPRFGSDLHNLIFEQNVDQINSLIEDSILQDVAEWLPYVDIENIDLKRDSVNIDTYIIELSITFRIKNDPTVLESVSFIIE